MTHNAVQRQKAAAAHFSGKQLLPFGLTGQARPPDNAHIKLHWSEFHATDGLAPNLDRTENPVFLYRCW